MFSPSAIRLRGSPLPLALPQPSGKPKNTHVSLNPLSVTLLRAAIQKARMLVKNLWRMRLPCGRLWKTKQQVWQTIATQGNAQILHGKTAAEDYKVSESHLRVE
jgi:hypothetical protein